MAVRRRPLYWGIFFVTAGAVMLLGQGSTLDHDAVRQALALWPVAVIAIGIALLLRGTRLGLPGGAVAAAMPGLLLGGMVVAGPDVTIDCGAAAIGGNAQARQGVFTGPATVRLNLACGDLTVTAVPGDAWHLETRDGTAAPTVNATGDRLSVESASQRHSFNFSHSADAWLVSLPTTHRLDLDAEVSAGKGRLDLAGAQLGNVDLAVNAGEARIDLTGATVGRVSLDVNAGAGWLQLPATGDLSGDLAVNAGKLSVCAPDGLGLRVRGDASLGSIDHRGLIRNGGAWESPGYAFAQNHADLVVSANLGAIDINPEGGCK
jgi:hypothetical protein